MELIIDIPDYVYEWVKNTGKFGMYRFDTAKVIQNGIPLDDVKEQMKETRRFHVGTFEDDNPIDYGIVEGFDKAIAILDNIDRK